MGDRFLPGRRLTGLADRLRALGTAGAVLQVGAHPDDEESGLLAYIARGQSARAVYWSATRGEGGQNRRGRERGEAFGVLRTWESLAAREIDGAEVLYGPFIDYGFSKSGVDTLCRWGRDDLVGEIVRAIRYVQPLVVIGRWGETPFAGHGHHQAVGMVLAEAIDAAADPARFPELGLPPWRPTKVYRSLAGDWQPGEHRIFGVEVPEYELADHLRVDTGVMDPVSGLSFQELAGLAINCHRSQGIGIAPEPGRYLYYYALERTLGAPVAGRETSFYEGVDAGLTGLADYPGAEVSGLRGQLERIGALAAAALDAYRPHAPWRALPPALEGLAVLRQLLERIGDTHPALTIALRRRAFEFEEAAVLCQGLRLECLADRARVTPGHEFSVRAMVCNGGPEQVEVERLELDLPEGWRARNGDGGNFTVSVPVDAAPRAPYWLRQPHGPYRYVWPADEFGLGQPLDRPAVFAVADVRVGSSRLTLSVPAVERSAFSGGARELPATVVPAIALAPRERRMILPVSDEKIRLECDALVECLEPTGACCTIRLAAPDGWTVEPTAAAIRLESSGDSTSVHFRVIVPAGAPQGSYQLRYNGPELNPVRLSAFGGIDDADDRSCLAEENLVRPAVVAVDLIDVQFVRTLRYGYVRGVEEGVPAVLVGFGLDLVELEDHDLAYSDLHAFDAIVVGPNAYNTRRELQRNAHRLLDFVAEGGTLIVQYQGYGYQEPGLAPHPFCFHEPHDRVTDPNAPVQLVNASHPVLHAPNSIGPADFENWVHDRGLYFFGEWDRRYTPVLACHDAGEPPLQGGLLTTVHGRGIYVYTGYSFFRQIPAGVPGAIRLFANLLGLPEARIRGRMERLRNLELFEYMNEDELYAAARIVSERWVDKGTLLAREGDPGRELFVLLDGAVEVVNELPAGERVLHLAGPGESIGELSLLADIPRSATLKAATDAVVLVLRADAFDALLERHADLARRLLRLLARKVASSNREA